MIDAAEAGRAFRRRAGPAPPRPCQRARLAQLGTPWSAGAPTGFVGCSRGRKLGLTPQGSVRFAKKLFAKSLRSL